MAVVLRTLWDLFLPPLQDFLSPLPVILREKEIYSGNSTERLNLPTINKTGPSDSQ